MAQNVTGFQTDAVSNRLKELLSQRDKLFKEVDKLNGEINRLSSLSEEEKGTYIDLDISLYPEIPTRIKNIFNNYGKEHHWPKPITARFIFNKGKEKIGSIHGIGYWSIVDLDNFFTDKGLSWK
ncbi:MAG: hypothetical protein K6B70_00800 [Clostridia bacterium]|nr:hypothetical protein [Clostridia bacterium]